MSDEFANTRLVYASSPSDVLCAQIALKRLGVGPNVLLLNTAHVRGDAIDKKSFSDACRTVADERQWTIVIDLPEVNASPIASQNRFRWVANSWFEVKTVNRLRRFFTNHDLSSVGAIFANCFHHLEVQRIIRAIPNTPINYYPHTFGSLNQAELASFDRYLQARRMPVIDRIKRSVFGIDAVPVRHIQVDDSYSFDLQCPGSTDGYSISKAELRSALEETSNRMKFDSGKIIRSKSAVILLSPADANSESYKRAEIDGYRQLACYFLKELQASQVYIKPHPRSGADWPQRVVNSLGQRAQNSVLLMESWRHLPIELLAAMTPFLACGVICSTAVRTISQLFGIKTYCPVSAWREAMRWSPEVFSGADQAWTDEFQADFIPI